MDELSHVDAQGRARMVDVGEKPATRRFARAEICVELGPELAGRILEGNLPKGDVLAAARLAGIQGAKRTSELIPLCHPLSLSYVGIDFEASPAGLLRVVCEARCTGPTGVEMEALCGASIAALTVYDMCKAVRRGIRIRDLGLVVKEGGSSGLWRREEAGEAEA